MKVTSRDRMNILLETVKQYYEMANNPAAMFWLITLDNDDVACKGDRFNDLVMAALPYPKTEAKVILAYGQSTSKINAINRDVQWLCKTAHENATFGKDWDILLNISDDQRPIVKGYDDIIRNAMPDDLDASLWFSDGQPRINTQEIIGRAYYERFGYIYHPAFKSLWCDNLSTDVALFLGKCKRFNQQIVKHYHPAWGGAEAFKMDPLYERNNTFWNEDEATYRRLVAEGLDKLTNRQLAR